MSRLPNISLSWKEGRFFDIWMLIHFGVGLAGGLSNTFFHLSPLAVLAIAAATMIAWEAFEYASGIREARINSVIDVLIGLAGTTLFWASSVLVTLGVVRGWLAYRRRTKRARSSAD